MEKLGGFKISVKSTFILVYISISIATFYHSAWGFSTLQGAMPERGFELAVWWIIGSLSAFAVDIGMGAIVYALLSGWKAKWLQNTLYILAFASAYTQVIYAAFHADAHALGQVASWLQWLQEVLDARVLILPILLPSFAIAYAFAAKIEEPGDDEAEQTITKIVNLTRTESEVLNFISENPEGVTREDIYTSANRAPSYASTHTAKLSQLGLIEETEGRFIVNGSLKA